MSRGFCFGASVSSIQAQPFKASNDLGSRIQSGKAADPPLIATRRAVRPLPGLAYYGLDEIHGGAPGRRRRGGQGVH
jgi:hypothetical protein